MSTVTLTAPAPHIAQSRTRLRLTARGRRVLAALAALPVVGAIAVATFAGGAALGSNDTGAPAGTFRSVTVMPGDSLWGIAERVELLGGRLAYGLDDDGRTFRATVELPWRGREG